MEWKGIKNVTVLRTEADVLSHSYGVKAADAPAPSPAPSPPPPAAPSVESVASSLEESHKKDELVALAESLDLDSTGTKAEIARRIAEHQLSS